MRTTIISGREVTYESEAQLAVLPGLDGEFSVLDFHQPFLYRLRRGIVKIMPAETVIASPEGAKQSQEIASSPFAMLKAPRNDAKEKTFRINDGLAKFSGNALLILCEIV